MVSKTITTDSIFFVQIRRRLIRRQQIRTDCLNLNIYQDKLTIYQDYLTINKIIVIFIKIILLFIKIVFQKFIKFIYKKFCSWRFGKVL